MDSDAVHWIKVAQDSAEMDFCEHCKGPSGSMKGGESLDELIDCQSLRFPLQSYNVCICRPAQFIV
jgi:hypothetical protein